MSENETLLQAVEVESGVIQRTGQWQEIIQGLTTCQAEWKSPARTKTGQVGSAPYRYASLESVLSTVRPLLAQHGIALIGGASEVGSGMLRVETWLLHSSGGAIGSVGIFPCPEGADSKERGSAETYARRYQTLNLLGLQPEDEDDDGDKAGTSKRRRSVQKPRQPTPPPPERSKQPPGTVRIRGRASGGSLIQTEPDKHAVGDEVRAWNPATDEITDVVLTEERNPDQKDRNLAFWLFAPATEDQS